MRASQFFLATQKEAPQEAELVSHRLMLRAGLIKRLGAGLYSWMPLGLRVLRKVEAIVRDEMNKAGALELLMPAIQPKELWDETGRWEVFGPQMLKIKDRHERDYCFGPTHEEVITDIARKEIRSYKQLPINFYQIQTKFRDEIRPRFGVMRAREFVMKDAYSFHTNLASLEQTYQVMYQSYSNIFNRLGLKFRAVKADPGAIGGDGSHEFHVLADSGEDALAYSSSSDYAANIELAEAVAPIASQAASTKTMEELATPNQKTIAEVAKFLGEPEKNMLKTLVYEGENGGLVAFLLRGDHELNEIKAAKLQGVGNGLRPASEEKVRKVFGAGFGSLGPIFTVPDFARRRPLVQMGNDQKNVLLIADRAVVAMSDFVCGANKDGHHFSGVNFGRDLPEPTVVADIRNIVAGDPSPDGKGILEICRGIEVGHIFQLGNKYSKAMNATYLDENGQSQAIEMGCYGIGVSRIVAAAIEQGNDERGIIFPASIAPFQVAIAAIGFERSDAVREAALKLHDEFQAAGIDVLLDDRGERPGVMFADLELIGIPYRIVIGERGLKENQVEYQARTDTEAQTAALNDIVGLIQKALGKKIS